MSVSLRPKGETFVRSAIALAVAKQNRADAAEYAAARWRPQSPATLVVRASAGSTTGWGEELAAARQATAEFFGLVAQASIVGRLSGLRRVPFLTRLASAVTGIGASWTAEGADALVSEAAYSVTSLERLKLTAVVVTTEELLKHSDPSAERTIRADLIRAVAEEIDKAFTDPSNSGVPGERPASITAGVTPVPMTAAIDADIVSLIDDFEGDLGAAYMIAHPAFGARLAGPARPEAGARGGTVAGIPLLTSRSAPEDTLILIDPQRIAAAEEGGDIRVTREATVAMVATSGGATEHISLWQTNSAAIGVLRFMNWTPLPGSVSILAGS